MQRRMSVDWQDWLDMGPDGPVRWIVYCIGKCSGQKYKNPSAPLKWEKEIVVLLVFWKSFVSIKKKTWRKLLILLSKFLCSSHQKCEHMPRCTSGHGRPTTRSSLCRYAQCHSEACVRPSKTTLARLTATRNTSDRDEANKGRASGKSQVLKNHRPSPSISHSFNTHILIILLFRLFKVIYVQKSLSERISPVFRQGEGWADRFQREGPGACEKSQRWRFGGRDFVGIKMNQVFFSHIFMVWRCLM